MPEGLVELESRHSVAETVAKLEALLAAKGITVFAVVDHSGEAAKAGMAMPDTKLILFGNPKAGTPVMLATPTAAIDLPLKILVREQDGKVLVSYNTAEYLRGRHGFSDDLAKNLAAAGALAEAIVA